MKESSSEIKLNFPFKGRELTAYVEHHPMIDSRRLVTDEVACEATGEPPETVAMHTGGERVILIIKSVIVADTYEAVEITASIRKAAAKAFNRDMRLFEEESDNC